MIGYFSDIVSLNLSGEAQQIIPLVWQDQLQLNKFPLLLHGNALYFSNISLREHKNLPARI